MKGEISNGGYLLIERAGKMKAQICPLFSNNTIVDGMPCGDWCPLFGEPKPTIDIGLYGSSEKTGQTTIEICHRDLIFDEFTDERNLEVCLEVPHD